MEQYCQICLWNDSFILFDDSEYTSPPFDGEFYRIQLLTGYNWIINPNCFNNIYVCNECLLEKVYMCNYESKYYMLEELKINMLVRKVLSKNNLPNEMFYEIYKFLYKV